MFIETLKQIHKDLNPNLSPIPESVVGVDRECPSLLEKRMNAIKYLGDKWVLAQKVKKSK